MRNGKKIILAKKKSFECAQNLNASMKFNQIIAQYSLEGDRGKNLDAV